jgi:hypothetical protein
VRGFGRPGFRYVVSSHCERDADGDGNHYKLYVNVSEEGAPQLLRLLSGLELQFTAKVGETRDVYSRRDTALVYVEPVDVNDMVAALLSFERENPNIFRGKTPPLTFPLSASIGIAESERVASVRSYGQLQCDVLAKGIHAALKRRLDFGPAWLKPLRAAFARVGRDLDTPWRKTLRFDQFTRWSAAK